MHFKIINSKFLRFDVLLETDTTSATSTSMSGEYKTHIV